MLKDKRKPTLTLEISPVRQIPQLQSHVEKVWNVAEAAAASSLGIRSQQSNSDDSFHQNVTQKLFLFMVYKSLLNDLLAIAKVISYNF